MTMCMRDEIDALPVAASEGSKPVILVEANDGLAAQAAPFWHGSVAANPDPGRAMLTGAGRLPLTPPPPPAVDSALRSVPQAQVPQFAAASRRGRLTEAVQQADAAGTAAGAGAALRVTESQFQSSSAHVWSSPAAAGNKAG